MTIPGALISGLFPLSGETAGILPAGGCHRAEGNNGVGTAHRRQPAVLRAASRSLLPVFPQESQRWPVKAQPQQTYRTLRPFPSCAQPGRPNSRTVAQQPAAAQESVGLQPCPVAPVREPAHELPAACSFGGRGRSRTACSVGNLLPRRGGGWLHLSPSLAAQLI